MHERRFHNDIARLRSPERLARLEVNRVVELVTHGANIRSVLDVGTGTGVFAEAFARSGLDVEGLDANPEILAAAEARLKAANTHVTAAEATMEFYELCAPFDGFLLGLDLAVGEAVTPTLPIAFLADTSRWIVETRDLAEIDAVNISIGDPAVIKLDAFPDEEFTGTVTKINPVGKLYLGDMTYQITVTLDEADARFLWNMTATVTVDTAGR